MYICKCLHNTGERSEPGKIDKNKLKTTFDPLSYLSLYTRPHLWQISGGSGPPVVPPPPPLDPRFLEEVYLYPCFSERRKSNWSCEFLLYLITCADLEGGGTGGPDPPPPWDLSEVGSCVDVWGIGDGVQRCFYLIINFFLARFARQYCT